MVPQTLWGAHGVVSPGRGWLGRCPRLRTLLLELLLVYVSVPFLIRLFPVILTKFIFLNFRECPGGESSTWASFWGAAFGVGGPGWGGGESTLMARGQPPAAEAALPVARCVLQAFCKALTPALFAARGCDTRGHAKTSVGRSLEVAEGRPPVVVVAQPWALG